jgi:hypothetical protein
MGDANGSGASKSGAGESNGTEADVRRELVEVDGEESQSLVTDGKGLLVNGRIGCSEVEKSKGAG